MELRKKRDPLAEYRTKRKLWTPANGISFLRMLMVVPAIYALSHGAVHLAATIFAIAALTDVLDGFIARRTGDVSEYGKIIDPLADKVFIGTVVVAMLWLGLVPLWFVLMILVRDAVILIAGLWAGRKFKVVLPSNYWGKAAVLVIALTLFWIVLGLSHDILVFLEGLSVALMIVSLIAYALRLQRVIRATSIEAI